MKLNKPHIYFFITAFAFFISALFAYNSEEAIDINIHDTYFVIANSLLMTLIFIFYSFIGLIYYLHFKFDVPQIKFLTKTHTIITIGCVIIYFLGSLFLTKNDFPLFEETFSLHNFLIVIILLGMIVQPIFIINSISSVIRNLLTKKH